MPEPEPTLAAAGHDTWPREIRALMRIDASRAAVAGWDAVATRAQELEEFLAWLADQGLLVAEVGVADEPVPLPVALHHELVCGFLGISEAELTDARTILDHAGKERR